MMWKAARSGNNFGYDVIEEKKKTAIIQLFGSLNLEKHKELYVFLLTIKHCF